MRRVWPFQLLLCLLVLAVTGLVALTYFPDAPVLEKAESWPLVGPLAQEIRRIYLPPPDSPLSPAREEEVAESRPSGVLREPPPPVIRREVQAFEAKPFEWFRAGTTVFEEPSLDAPAILTLDNPARFALFEKRGEWAQIRLASRVAWILVNEQTISLEPPLGSEPAPVLPVSGRLPDPHRLAEARRLLSSPGSRRQLGPYQLTTDVSDESLLAFLDNVARHHEEAHRQRYGLPVVGEPAAAVVLFSRERDYRRFQESEKGLEGLRAAGHAGSGIVALPVGGSSREVVAGVLLHELTHLVNRRAIGPALPPWLEEGLAEDLGGCRTDDQGRILPGTVQSSQRRTGTKIETTGFAASLRILRRTSEEGRLVPLAKLLSLEWEGFVGESRLPIHYAQSAMLIRFLLAPETGYAPRFRSFLDGVSRGEPATAEALETHLGQSWPVLERRFRAWLRVQLEGV